MKKVIGILIVAFAFCSILTPAFAEENQDRGWQDSQQPQSGQGMMGRGQGMGMKMGMMGGMMQKDSVVATSDGGVVVMQGPRLIKYDKDLTLVKEVELPRGKKPGQERQEQDDERGIPPSSDQLPPQGEEPPLN